MQTGVTVGGYSHIRNFRQQKEFQSGSKWPMFQLNSTNTSHLKYESSPGDGFAKKWSYKTNDRVESSPAVVDGTLFIGSHDGKIYAIDASSGDLSWSFETGDSVRSSPAVRNGTVYVGSYDGNIYALDIATGEELWNISSSLAVHSSPTVFDNTVFIGTNENLFAIDGDSGELLWEGRTGGVSSTPAVSGGRVYVSILSSAVMAIDRNSGSTVWEFKTGNRERSSPVVFGGTVFVGSRDEAIYALDAKSGQEEWSFETDGEVVSSAAVDDDTIYIGSNDSKLYALDASSGEKQWSFETGDAIQSSPTLIQNRIYVGSLDGKLYSLNTSGEEIWSYEIGPVSSSPSIATGSLYVGSEMGNVYAIDLIETKQPEHQGSTRLGTLLSIGFGGALFGATALYTFRKMVQGNDSGSTTNYSAEVELENSESSDKADSIRSAIELLEEGDYENALNKFSSIRSEIQTDDTDEISKKDDDIYELATRGYYEANIMILKNRIREVEGHYNKEQYEDAEEEAVSILSKLQDLTSDIDNFESEPIVHEGMDSLQQELVDLESRCERYRTLAKNLKDTS